MVYTAPTQRNTGDLITSDIWNTDLVDNIAFGGTTHDHSGDTGDGGDLIRGIMLSPGGVTGTSSVWPDLDDSSPAHLVATLADNETNLVYFQQFSFPTNFQALDKAVIVHYPRATGNLMRSLGSAYGADGQDQRVHIGSVGLAAVAMVDNTLNEDDVSAAFTSVAAGDHMTANMQRSGSDSLDTLNANHGVAGLYMEWH